MPTNLQQLKFKKSKGNPICALTCYDATFAKILDISGVDVILVGDSLGMVIQGNSSTLKVTLKDMIYHTNCVSKNIKNSMIMVDMPFGSYQKSPEQAYSNASQLLESGGEIVKLEGGKWLSQTIKFLSDRGIPSCAHLGLTPQSVHKIGGYKIQGKEKKDAKEIFESAKILEESGVDLIILELVPSELGKRISKTVSIPTIGIGAGSGVDGQIMVLYDLLGVSSGAKPKFVKNFLESSKSIENAIKNYVDEVKKGKYPDSTHSY